MSELSQLGLDEGSVLDAAAHLGDAELQRLIYTLEQIIEVVSPKRFSLTEAKGLPSSIANLKKSYADDLAGLMDDLAQQGLSPKEFEKAVRPLVSDNFEKAFKLGSKRDLMPGDEEWLRRAVDSEVGYARDLADGVAKGATITPDLRANSYAAALDGVGWNGAVESMPEGTVVHWVLGQAEHCDDCILLACFLTFHLTIETKRGKIPLSEVRVGDLVLTHMGRYRPVLAMPVKPSPSGKRCAVLCTEEGLVGLTADHRLWTARGWMTAEEVFHAEERCLPGLRQGDRQAGGTMQELCWVSEGGTQDLRTIGVGGLQVPKVEEQILGIVLHRREGENGLAPSLALGDEQREGAPWLSRASQERGPVGRPAGELGAKEAERASVRSCEGRKESTLERGSDGTLHLQSLRQGVQGLEVEAETVLLEGVRSTGSNEDGYVDIDVRPVREGVRAASLPVGTPETLPTFLLSRLLSEAPMGGPEHEDPAVRILREAYQAKAIQDQELEIGQVLLFPGLLPEGSLLYDLTVEEDHSFVAAGLVVHNSHSPYDKYSLPTTPRAGDTDCRCITTPDSRVWTNRGMIPISAVETGDEVITHLGRWRRVLGTYRSKPSLKHRQAWVRGLFGRVVGCTHDHKFLTDCGWASAFFIEKAQLPMYAIGHELQSMWEEDQVGQQARDLQRMPLGVSDLRAKEGLSGRGVHFVRQAAEGAVSVGGPIIQDAHCGRIASRWVAATRWVRWAARGILFSATERWAIHRCVLGEGREAEIRLPLPVALDQGEWGDSRRGGGASSERRSYRRRAGESLLDAFWRACRISLQRGQESEQEEVSCQTSCRAADEIFLYDLEVEDDHSFIIEGLVAHNSNCKCRLVFKQGEDAGEPQDGVFGIDAYLGADEMPVPMQGEGLLDWLAPGEAPEGMMLPNATERLAMDEMYNEVNYNRRLMSQLEPDSEEFMAAVQARKEANGELIDYMEERGIWDKPLLSVDEVITGKDISMVAERDLFEIGLSGDALEGANAEVVKLVEQYKVNLGKKFKGGPK